MKKLAIMQPYLFPYLGYFQLMNAVDQYVIYDDVQFIKGGWISRNNILMQGQKKAFAIRLLGASPNRLINEVQIDDDFGKFLKMIASSYARAPYKQPVLELLETISAFPDKNLAGFITNSFTEIAKYIGIKTDLIVSSKLKKDTSLKGQDKVLAICAELDVDVYINAIGGQDLYSRSDFEAKGIQLKFLKTDPVTYPQLISGFVPDLSIIDVFMFNSPQEVSALLDRYELV